MNSTVLSGVYWSPYITAGITLFEVMISSLSTTVYFNDYLIDSFNVCTSKWKLSVVIGCEHYLYRYRTVLPYSRNVTMPCKSFLACQTVFLNLSSPSSSFLSLQRIWITSVIILANWCIAIFSRNVDYFSIVLAVDFQQILSLQFHIKGYWI